jgi:hypothetical protein
MRVMQSIEGWSARREAEKAAREYNRYAAPTEYAHVIEPQPSDPLYRVRIIAFQPGEFVGE